MALLFMDSFDNYATADIAEKWTSLNTFSASGTGTINSTGGRRSSGSFRWVTGTAATNQGGVFKTLSPTGTTIIIGFAFQMSANPTGSNGLTIAAIKDGSTTQASLRLNADLTLSVLRGPAPTGTSLGATSATLSIGIFNYIEWRVLIDNTVGTTDIQLNGVNVFTRTGQDTQNSTTATWTAISLGAIDAAVSSGSGTPRNIDYDDFYVCDGTGSAPWNTFLGDCRVDPRYPTAEGTTIGWTPLSGSDNALMVDETAPDDDTTYNEAASTGLTDTFVTQDSPVAGATIYGIQHNLSMKKTDAGICTIAPVIRHSGVDNVGSSLSPGTSYAYGLQIASVNPGTSAAWIEADFNAAEFGYKRLT